MVLLPAAHGWLPVTMGKFSLFLVFSVRCTVLFTLQCPNITLDYRFIPGLRGFLCSSLSWHRSVSQMLTGYLLNSFWVLLSLQAPLRISSPVFNYFSLNICKWQLQTLQFSENWADIFWTSISVHNSWIFASNLAVKNNPVHTPEVWMLESSLTKHI